MSRLFSACNIENWEGPGGQGYQVVQEGELDRNRRKEASVCADGFITHELQEFKN